MLCTAAVLLRRKQLFTGDTDDADLQHCTQLLHTHDSNAVFLCSHHVIHNDRKRPKYIWACAESFYFAVSPLQSSVNLHSNIKDYEICMGFLRLILIFRSKTILKYQICWLIIYYTYLECNKIFVSRICNGKICYIWTNFISNISTMNSKHVTHYF